MCFVPELIFGKMYFSYTHLHHCADVGPVICVVVGQLFPHFWGTYLEIRKELREIHTVLLHNCK